MTLGPRNPVSMVSHIGCQIGRACLVYMLPPESAKSPEDLCLLHPGPLLSAGDKMQLSFPGAI